MARLILDAATLARLQNHGGPVEVCDESGRILGYFHPARRPEDPTSPASSSPFTDEELQRRRQQRTGRPLAEMLARLGRP